MRFQLIQFNYNRISKKRYHKSLFTFEVTIDSHSDSASGANFVNVRPGPGDTLTAPMLNSSITTNMQILLQKCIPTQETKQLLFQVLE